MVEWFTRRSQKPLGASPCGFDSHLRHIMPRKLTDKTFEWNENLAYAIGLLATDGNLSSDKRHIILRSSDTQLLQTFAKCFSISNSIGENSVGGYTKKSCYRIQFGNVQMYRWLTTIGLSPAKTHTIGSLKIPSGYFKDFLRGHFDGDGSLTIYKDHYNTFKNPKYIYTRLWLRFISASENHMRWLRSRIIDLTGIKGHTWVDSTSKNPNAVPIYVLKFGKRDSVRLLNWMYYKENLPCLKRKYKKAQPYLRH